MEIRETIRIRAPVATVWRVFTDIENWETWNTVCRECRLEEGGALEKGACISFSLSPLIFPLRIAPVVEARRENETIVWSGGKWGVRARHAFFFRKADENGKWTELESIEVFSGPLLWAARLAGLHRRLHRLTLQLLKAIREEAEATAVDGVGTARANNAQAGSG